MRTSAIFIMILISTANIFGQAAGNYFFNQSKGRYNNSSSNTELYEMDNYIQQSTRYTSPSRSYFSDTIIILETKLLMNVEADEYNIIIGVSQVGETIDICQKLIIDRINAFKENIKNIGISEDQVYVDFISQIPIYELELDKKLFSKSYIEVPAGFEIKKNIHISFKDNKVIDKLLEVSAKNEMYDIIKVDYIIKDNNAIYDTLRAEAIKNIKRKKLDFEELDVDFSSMYKTITESKSSVFPIERYSSYKAFNSSVKTKISDKKTINKQSTQITIFYNKYPYNTFDVIINPSMLEPSVQFIYTMNIKYVLKKK